MKMEAKAQICYVQLTMLEPVQEYDSVANASSISSTLTCSK